MTIYQLFCGRQQDANVLTHQGQVLKKMLDWQWLKFKNNGFDTIYLLGLFDHQGPLIVNEENGLALENIPQRTPSIFAITNHRKVDQQLGTEADLVSLVKKLHDHQLKVLVDFVGNQTSVVHNWVQTHPEFYLRDNENMIKKAFSQDVLLLDHTRVEIRNDLKTTLLWLAHMGIDGVRCDMAHLMKPQIWDELITEVKRSYPDFYFLAEAYSDSLFNWQPLLDLLDAGFDSIYHEFLYRNLRGIAALTNTNQDLFNHLNYIIEQPFKDKLVHYLSNHDDPAVDMTWGLSEALYSLLMFLPGNLLIYNGGLHHRYKRLAHHYIDLLGRESSEINTVPQWFMNLTHVKTSLQAKINSIISVDNGILKASLVANQNPGILVCNLQAEPVVINKASSLPGLLHFFKNFDTLPPYQAELWLTG